MGFYIFPKTKQSRWRLHVNHGKDDAPRRPRGVLLWSSLECIAKLNSRLKIADGNASLIEGTKSIDYCGATRGHRESRTSVIRV